MIASGCLTGTAHPDNCPGSDSDSDHPLTMKRPSTDHHHTKNPSTSQHPHTPPANFILKTYILLLAIGLALAIATIVIGAALMRPTAFHIFQPEDYRKYFGDLADTDRILFGTATIVLGAWLATIEAIMLLLALHVLRKHYHGVTEALRHGQPVVNTENYCPEVINSPTTTGGILKRPDQFGEPFFPLRKPGSNRSMQQRSRTGSLLTATPTKAPDNDTGEVATAWESNPNNNVMQVLDAAPKGGKD